MVNDNYGRDNYALEMEVHKREREQIVYLTQGESSWIPYHVYIRDNKYSIDYTNATVEFRATLPDGTFVNQLIDSKDIDSVTGQIKWYPVGALTQTYGRITVAHFVITNEDKVIKTRNMTIEIEKTPDLSGKESEAFISQLDEVKNKVVELDTYVDEIDKRVKAIEDEITNNPDKFRGLKGDKGIQGIQGPKGDMDLSQITVGGRNLIVRTGELAGNIIGGTGQIEQFGGNSTMKNSIPVNPGAQLTMSGTTGGSEILFRYAFYDADGNLLTRAFVAVTKGTTATAPAGSSTFRISYPQNSQVKLERGNVPTDWTPAPEDVDNTYVKKSDMIPTTGTIPVTGSLKGATIVWVKSNNIVQLQMGFNVEKGTFLPAGDAVVGKVPKDLLPFDIARGVLINVSGKGSGDHHVASVRITNSGDIEFNWDNGGTTSSTSYIEMGMTYIASCV